MKMDKDIIQLNLLLDRAIKEVLDDAADKFKFKKDPRLTPSELGMEPNPPEDVPKPPQTSEPLKDNPPSSTDQSSQNEQRINDDDNISNLHEPLKNYKPEPRRFSSPYKVVYRRANNRPHQDENVESQQTSEQHERSSTDQSSQNEQRINDNNNISNPYEPLKNYNPEPRRFSSPYKVVYPRANNRPHQDENVESQQTSEQHERPSTDQSSQNEQRINDDNNISNPYEPLKNYKPEPRRFSSPYKVVYRRANERPHQDENVENQQTSEHHERPSTDQSSQNEQRINDDDNVSNLHESLKNYKPVPRRFSSPYKVIYRRANKRQQEDDNLENQQTSEQHKRPSVHAQAEKPETPPQDQPKELDADRNAWLEQPLVVTRSRWGALPPMGKLEPMQRPPSGLTFSMSTGTDACSTPKECQRAVKEIQARNMGQGLADIQYNFLVGGDGNMYEGRGWYIQNGLKGEGESSSLNIAFIGDYSDDANKVPPQMLGPVQNLVMHGRAVNLLVSDKSLTTDVLKNQ